MINDNIKFLTTLGVGWFSVGKEEDAKIFEATTAIKQSLNTNPNEIPDIELVEKAIAHLTDYKKEHEEQAPIIDQTVTTLSLAKKVASLQQKLDAIINLKDKDSLEQAFKDLDEAAEQLGSKAAIGMDKLQAVFQALAKHNSPNASDYGVILNKVANLSTGVEPSKVQSYTEMLSATLSGAGTAIADVTESVMSIFEGAPPLSFERIGAITKKITTKLREGDTLSSEGIFRLSGRKLEQDSLLKQLLEEPNLEKVALDTYLTNSIATVLKLVWGEKPIFTEDLLKAKNNEERQVIISQLDPQAKENLGSLLSFLHEVSEIKSNKMTFENLGTCWGPRLFPPSKAADPMEALCDSNEMNEAVAYLIEHHKEFNFDRIIRL